MNTYHTSLKIAYSLNLQKQWVDKVVRDKIPASTAAYWKNIEPEKIIGTEISTKIQQKLSDIQASHHTVNTVPLAIFNAYCRFTVMIANLFKDDGFRKVLRKNKEKIINTIDELAEHIPYKKAAGLLNLTEKTLYHWRTIVKFKCDHSSLLLCVKRHPNQATILEVNNIKKWLTKTELKHWSIHAIWAKAFKSGETVLSRHSWYFYNQILKIRTSPEKGEKPKNPPLKASSVNQIWHADITVFKTLDGVKYYIYTVMDNYSRYVHSWRIETVVSGAIRTQTIRDAIKNAFGEKSFEDLQLVTDGGPENDNQSMKEFIQSVKINHTIALKDVVNSNSMMEALYSIAKYRYLYLHQIKDYDDLVRIFTAFIQEYHFERPHYALGIYTPSEVLNGAYLSISHKNTYAEAARKRREINRNSNCKQKCQ